MKTQVKVRMEKNKWRVASLKNGVELETIPISQGNKWGPLLKRAMLHHWHVVQCENAMGMVYEWFEEEKLWIPIEDVITPSKSRLTELYPSS